MVQACVNVTQLLINELCRPHECSVSNSTNRQNLGGTPADADVQACVLPCTVSDLVQVKADRMEDACAALLACMLSTLHRTWRCSLLKARNAQLFEPSHSHGLQSVLHVQLQPPGVTAQLEVASAISSSEKPATICCGGPERAGGLTSEGLPSTVSRIAEDTERQRACAAISNAFSSTCIDRWTVVDAAPQHRKADSGLTTTSPATATTLAAPQASQHPAVYQALDDSIDHKAIFAGQFILLSDSASGGQVLQHSDRILDACSPLPAHFSTKRCFRT